MTNKTWKWSHIGGKNTLHTDNREMRHTEKRGVRRARTLNIALIVS